MHCSTLPTSHPVLPLCLLVGITTLDLASRGPHVTTTSATSRSLHQGEHGRDACLSTCVCVRYVRAVCMYMQCSYVRVVCTYLPCVCTLYIHMYVSAVDANNMDNALYMYVQYSTFIIMSYVRTYICTNDIYAYLYVCTYHVLMYILYVLYVLYVVCVHIQYWSCNDLPLLWCTRTPYKPLYSHSVSSSHRTKKEGGGRFVSVPCLYSSCTCNMYSSVCTQMYV